MKCPDCQTELIPRLIYEEPTPPVALAPKRIMELRCPKCGYTQQEIIPYTETKTCPKCGEETYVVKKEDTCGVTKVGYYYYCQKCNLEFSADWG
jgi:transposase